MTCYKSSPISFSFNGKEWLLEETFETVMDSSNPTIRPVIQYEIFVGSNFHNGKLIRTIFPKNGETLAEFLERGKQDISTATSLRVINVHTPVCEYVFRCSKTGEFPGLTWYTDEPFGKVKDQIPGLRPVYPFRAMEDHESPFDVGMNNGENESVIRLV